GEEASSVVLGTADIPKAGYELIICQPPIGHKLARDNAADGFGGEIVRELAPLLTEKGTLYWITGRGGMGAQPAQKTVAHLQDAELNVVATIDLGPGMFATAIPGIILALRHETPAKKFVGALRAPDAPESVASALLAGPTRKPGSAWMWLDFANARTLA